MPDYRKKPVVIQAVQFLSMTKNEVNFSDYPNWLVRAEIDPTSRPLEGKWCTEADHLLIGTKEGMHIASEGDWIIRGVAGELYPCKPDIFEQTYEAVS